MSKRYNFVTFVFALLSFGLAAQGAHAQTGACCDSPGFTSSCSDTDPFTCFIGGGTFAGDGTTCAAVDCAGAVQGACCFLLLDIVPTCNSGTWDIACSGSFGGQGSVCAVEGAVESCDGSVFLPVELTNFEAIVDGQGVHLLWATASELNNAGFSVEQEVGSDVFAEIGFVNGHGTTTQPKEYSFAVGEVDPGEHRFRLKQVDFDGAFEYSSVVEAVVTVPDRFLIEAAYPNPFNPTTTIRFAVAAEQQVEVTLVNAAGQSIRTLYRGTVAPNEMQRLTIDAGSLPSGTYLVHFEGNGFSASERIILAK